MNDITRILSTIDKEPAAAEQLLPLVYEELRKLAHAKMTNEPPGQTLQATALVHEAYLRLVGTEEQPWANRAHFFAAAAEAMRRILIDCARKRRALRHGGGQEHLPLEGLEIAAPATDDELLAVDEALQKFSSTDREKAEVVKLKYFGGFSNSQAAEILGISEATAKRHWAYARAWLFREIQRASRV